MNLQRLFGLDGKVALVTGGAGGLGRAITEGLLEAGAARVYIASRKLAQLKDVAEELSKDGRCVPIAADLSNIAGCKGLAEEIGRREKALHILVNNSGTPWSAPFASFPESGWDKVFALNLKAPFFLTQALAPLLAAAGSQKAPARVINIGSVAGNISNGAGTYPYGLSKGALHHATRMLALELAPQNILVNAIAPGRFATRMTKYVTDDQPRYDAEVALIPTHRWGADDDIAGTAVFLASHASAYITGATVPVDGGTQLVHPFDMAG
jgi:NAD(P)-dependent dehydrogenase (short-subunit alcohol dehydrogenase family)